MKRIIVLVCVGLLSIHGFCQKKKTPAAAAGLAKIDNLIAEVKSGNFQVTITENGKPKDAMIVKAADAKFAPQNCKLSSFLVSGTKLYLLSWSEKSGSKTDLKTEDITTVYSVVYEMANKKQVFSNTQTTNHITEKVFLDKLKNASETQEKIRREGFEFILNPDGSIIQKNKTQQNYWVYDMIKVEYVPKKR